MKTQEQQMLREALLQALRNDVADAERRREEIFEEDRKLWEFYESQINNLVDDEDENTEQNKLIVATFKKDCLGAIIMKRGENDNHLCVRMIVEDDGVWFANGNGFSSVWLPEAIEAMNDAQKWLEENAVDDNGYGYKLSRFYIPE